MRRVRFCASGHCLNSLHTHFCVRARVSHLSPVCRPTDDATTMVSRDSTYTVSGRCRWNTCTSIPEVSLTDSVCSACCSAVVVSSQSYPCARTARATQLCSQRCDARARSVAIAHAPVASSSVARGAYGRACRTVSPTGPPSLGPPYACARALGQRSAVSVCVGCLNSVLNKITFSTLPCCSNLSRLLPPVQGAGMPGFSRLYSTIEYLNPPTPPDTSGPADT